MSKSIPNNITAFIQKLESLPVTKLYKLDALLSDVAKHIYEIEEHISELKDEIKKYDKNQTERILKELTTLEEQLNFLFNLLYKMGYEGHYMYRVQGILSTAIDKIKKLVTELK